MIKYKVINTKTKETLHVSAISEKDALLVVSSDNPVGGGWKREDVKIEKVEG